MHESMKQKEELISEIVTLEWEMFSKVKNRGGRASCQEDPVTFRIIRSCNFMIWSDATLKSYLDDLQQIKSTGRNPMTEKYARMEALIEPRNPENLPLIDRIVKRECRWAEELQKKYPDVKMARPIYSSQDTPFVVSSETYSCGELETYSRKTLELYDKDNQDLDAKGQNRIEMAMRLMNEKFSEAGRNQSHAKAQRRKV